MIPLPSRWLVLVLVVLAAASLLVIVFAEAALWLLLAVLFLAGVAVFDLLMTPSPRRLEIQRLAPIQMSVLRAETITLIVRNRSRAPLRVRIRDGYPTGFEVPNPELAGRVPARNELHIDYRVISHARGLFRWGAIHVRYLSLLGLWEKRTSLEAAAEARVYPNLVELHRYQLLARTNRLDTLGVRKVRQRGGGWEFESLRDYADGDDVRNIDWKATSRRRKMIVRQHQVERNQTVLLLIDSGRLMTAEVGGMAKLDHAINAALILAHISLKRGDRVGLCTFSSKVHSWVKPRGHIAQTRLLTESLYNLKGDFTETDHGRALRLVAARHSKRALLVVLTDFVDATTASEMVAHLQLAARRHLVVFCALKDPFVEKAGRVLPTTELEGFRKTAALELLHERSLVFEQLRQAGMMVIDAEPHGVTPPLLNRYLEATTRGLL